VSAISDEQEAISANIVQEWVGDRGTVENSGGTGGGPDFKIHYSDGREAVGEVGWNEDPVTRKMWGATFKQAQHQRIPLHAGSGTWSVHLAAGANVKGLYKSLPDLVADIVKADIASQLDMHMYPDEEVLAATPNRDQWELRFPEIPLVNRARSLGIEWMRFYDSGIADEAVFFMPGGGGYLSDDPNVIVPWIDSVLHDPHYADMSAKLLPFKVQERHVFIWSGGLTPIDADDRLRRVVEGLPGQNLNVPAGITHVWALSQWGPSAALLWSYGQWAVVPMPAADQ
jgi:hypothetical protein